MQVPCVQEFSDTAFHLKHLELDYHKYYIYIVYYTDTSVDHHSIFVIMCSMHSCYEYSICNGICCNTSVTLDSSSLEPPSSVTYGVTSNTTMSISWSQVSNATGYYVSYQRQDLGTPPVVTPQYERIVGRDNTNVTLSGLEPGTTYRIRVWSTDGTSVSNKAREIMVPSVDTGKRCHESECT